MLHIDINKWNNIVYTASEFDSTNATEFILELESQQTFKTTSYLIDDISLFLERYNKSIITVVTPADYTTLADNLTVNEGEILAFDQNIKIPIGVTLTNNGAILMLGATMNVLGTYTQGTEGSLIYPSYAGTPITQYNVFTSVVIVGLLEGFYNYKIKDKTDTLIFETGKLLIGGIPESDTTQFVGAFPDKTVFTPERWK